MLHEYINIVSLNIINAHIKRKDITLHFHGIAPIEITDVRRPPIIRYSCDSISLDIKEIEARDLVESWSEQNYVARVINYILDDNTKDQIRIRTERTEREKKEEREFINSNKDKMYFTLDNKVYYIKKKDFELNLRFNRWLDSKERAEGISFDNYKDGK